MPKRIELQRFHDLHKRHLIAKGQDRFNTVQDRITIWKLSWTCRYPSARALAKISNRTSGRKNYRTLKLTKTRSYSFVKRWWQAISEEKLYAREGIEYFERNCTKRKRKPKN